MDSQQSHWKKKAVENIFKILSENEFQPRILLLENLSYYGECAPPKRERVNKK